MKVLKRDGRVQDFDINKIVLSLQNASDEAQQPFTGADINNLSKAICEEAQKNGREEITSREILDIVLNKLIEFGFSSISKYYREYETNFYKDQYI